MSWNYIGHEPNSIPDKMERHRNETQEGRNGRHSAAGCRAVVVKGKSLIFNGIPDRYNSTDFLWSTAPGAVSLFSSALQDQQDRTYFVGH